jgi:hypothetical protein
MNELCSICREVMDDKKQHYILKCNHRFHTECIIDSLRANNECPICRDTDGYKSFVSKYEHNDIQYENYNTIKKNAFKLKSDDFNNIIKLMNEISESSVEIKRLRNDIKKQVTIFKKNTNNIYRDTKIYRNALDKKYKEDINAYLLSITSSEAFEKSVISKNIYKNKIVELHRIIHKQILDMGIPSDAFESAKFYSKMKTQYEKNNNIYIDDYHNEIYNIINKNIKKVNNNIILTI